MTGLDLVERIRQIQSIRERLPELSECELAALHNFCEAFSLSFYAKLPLIDFAAGLKSPARKGGTKL